MTPKQRKFVTEYMGAQNVEAAYLRAGYVGKNLTRSATKVMRGRAVGSAIEKLKRDEKLAAGRAKVALDPITQGALTVRAYGEEAVGEIEILHLTDALTELSDRIAGGNLDDAQTMLAVQAHTLDGIYNKLVRDALSAELLEQFETKLKLALRAQSQCRATWEAVSLMQNPPIASYVNQANISRGHQQVNNEVSPSRARDENLPTKLLESKHGSDAWMDGRATQAAGAAYPQVAAMGGINGTQDSKRQG